MRRKIPYRKQEFGFNRSSRNAHMLSFFVINLLLLSHVSRVRLCATLRRQPTSSSVPGILQARTLEWVAISFSSA